MISVGAMAKALYHFNQVRKADGVKDQSNLVLCAHIVLIAIYLASELVNLAEISEHIKGIHSQVFLFEFSWILWSVTEMVIFHSMIIVVGKLYDHY